jgi:hypothetical protein
MAIRESFIFYKTWWKKGILWRNAIFCRSAFDFGSTVVGLLMFIPQTNSCVCTSLKRRDAFVFNQREKKKSLFKILKRTKIQTVLFQLIIRYYLQCLPFAPKFEVCFKFTLVCMYVHMYTGDTHMKSSKKDLKSFENASCTFMQLRP